MASSLFKQLAEIRANGSNSLDLKAQKNVHSQSLIFNAHDAALQDFDTLFLICYDGFEELCRLDARFSCFVHTLFSEQSKYKDRNQLTELQNSQLNVILEDFLALVGSKLLLRPAQKAVEWLIRRFKVHHSNTICLALTFLPYHSNSIFLNFLSILPDGLPPMLKFLYPYIQSQANPPRHVMVYAAAHNTTFLAKLNARVLEVSNSGCHFPVLLSFWASTVTEAVATMIDRSRSGPRETQVQMQEDLIYRLVPTLSEGLMLKAVPDVQIGCYMIFTVLVMKACLDSKVSTATMRTIASNWSRTQEAGLTCIAAIAQTRGSLSLPNCVFKALLAVEGLIKILITLKTLYKVDCLVLGIVLGISQDYSCLDLHRIELVSSLVKTDLLEHSYLQAAVAALVSMAQKPHQTVTVRILIEDLLFDLAEDVNIGPLFKDGIKKMNTDLTLIQPKLRGLIDADRDHSFLCINDEDAKEVKSTTTTETLDDALNKIPRKTTVETSFLSHSDSDVFDHLAHAFAIACSSADDLKCFSELAILRKSYSSTEPLYLSFFIRFWCGNYLAKYRAAAIQSVFVYLKDENQASGLQLVFPYILYGLADSSLSVRQASANLVELISQFYDEGKVDIDSIDSRQKQLYGSEKPADQTAWLSWEEAGKFTKEILMPSLKECLLDSSYISQRLLDTLGGLKHSRISQISCKELKAALRQKFFLFLCSHVIDTPLYAVKLRLLQMLNQIKKVGNISRTKALLPLVYRCFHGSQGDFEKSCIDEQISQSEVFDQIFQVVLGTDRKGVQILQDIMELNKRTDVPLLQLAAHQRIRSIWGTIKADQQSSLAKALLEIAVREHYITEGSQRYDEAFDTLHEVKLSTPILQSFLERSELGLSKIRENPRIPKRRRTSHELSAHSIKDNYEEAGRAIRRFRLVLELINTCLAERHPQLLKGLFQVLEQLQLHRNDSSVDIGYLQVQIMENILAILKSTKEPYFLKIDQAVIQPDIIIESLKSTTSTQVQQVALLLIAVLASISPDSVLHSIMPVFTYMNASTLRQSNEYSAYVVNQIMESTIPQLVKSLDERGKHPNYGVSELLLSFVATFDHIPLQRRLELFQSLTNKIGPMDFLFVLIIILLDKYPGNKQVVHFAVNLIRRYDIETQFHSIEKYLSFVLELFEPYYNSFESLGLIGKDRDAKSTAANLLPLVITFLKSRELSSTLRAAFDREGKIQRKVKKLYERILEKILGFLNIIKHDEIVYCLVDQILESLFDLPATAQLLDIVGSLFMSAQNEIQQRLLKSLQQPLEGSTDDHETAQRAYIRFLPLLMTVLKDTTHLPLIHASIHAADVIMRKIGTKNKDTILDAVAVVSSDHILGTSESKVHIAALRCLATSVGLLKEVFIPIIPTTLPKVFDQLNVSLTKNEEHQELHNAAYSLICDLLSYLPWIISGQFLDRLLTESYKSAESTMGKLCDHKRAETLQLIAMQIESHKCFNALNQTWKNAIVEGPTAMKEHLRILRNSIDRQPRSSIMKQCEVLTETFIKAFDFRNQQYSLGPKNTMKENEINDVENDVIDSAIAMIYKLNDISFRPVFLRIWDWSVGMTDNDGTTTKIHRKTTVYAFLAQFFDSFQSVVTNYAGFIIEDAVSLLKELKSLDNESKLLWKRVVYALHKALEYDQDDFWQSPAHFSAVADALLCQFTHASQMSMESEIIPTVVELAATADSTNHLIELNNAILQHMRSDSASTRLAAIHCEHGLASRLGEEWLARLPEMLPFINELQEDDDESVKTALQNWIVEIEQILGNDVNFLLQ